MADAGSGSAGGENPKVESAGETWRWLLPLLLIAALAILAWYFLRDDDPENGASFYILTGSENRILFDDPDSEEPTIMERFEDDHDVDFIPSFQGSVDTMISLQAGAEPNDAVWPASSIWLNLGDTEGIVSRTESIMGSPVVFGVKRSKAEELGWVGEDVYVEGILEAAESSAITYMMSSATQSNSGAMAYLGYLYAFAGQPDVLTSEDLQKPEVQENTTLLLSEVDRTAASSGFLRDLFLEQYPAYDGMVNNESAIITTNQELKARGETDLLYVVYPVDGLALADFPLGFIDRGSEEKSDLFDELQAYLLSDVVQQELLDLGWRTNSFNYEMNEETVDPTVFNPDWGIDVKRVIDPIVIPAEPVLLEALNLYQSSFRKPSFTVLALDYSGSMDGSGEEEMKEAMRVLLDQDEAAKYFLQRTGQDVTIVIPFNEALIDEWRADGNSDAELDELLLQVTEQEVGGMTNIYDPLIEALDEMNGNLDEHSPAIILLTDGHSNNGTFEEFAARWNEGAPPGVPVFSIMFGDADDEQLTQISELTSGNVYDGRDGLIDALRDSYGNA